MSSSSIDGTFEGSRVLNPNARAESTENLSLFPYQSFFWSPILILSINPLSFDKVSPSRPLVFLLYK